MIQMPISLILYYHILYDGEVWANNDPKITELIHLKCCKYILCVKKQKHIKYYDLRMT